MKTKIFWLTFIFLSFFNTRLFCNEYIKSINQLTFEDSIDYYPDWSPDGKYISFDNYNTKNIQRILSSGGVPIRITPKTIPGKRKRDSCWSPNGKIIAFYADGDVYVINLSSGTYKNIFHRDGYSARPHCWISDGSGLLVDVQNTKNKKLDIWFISSDGHTTRQITNFEGSETTPSLSPDDSMIVFTADISGNYDIWLMSLKSKNKIQLTKNTKKDMTPRWSPDGTKIAFASERSGNRDIWVMKLDIALIKKRLGLISP